MKITWQEVDGTSKSWEGDFIFERIGCAYDRVTDRLTSKVKVFFCSYEIIREREEKSNATRPQSKKE